MKYIIISHFTPCLPPPPVHWVNDGRVWVVEEVEAGEPIMNDPRSPVPSPIIHQPDRREGATGEWRVFRVNILPT